MKIVIIGSLRNADEIKMAKQTILSQLSYRGYLEIVTPVDEEFQDNLSLSVDSGRSLTLASLFEIQKRYVGHILSSDLVIVVPKDDGSIGESTSYEMAMASYYDKPIFIWGAIDKKFKEYLKEE